jgi:hypothetical protein
VRRAGLAFAPRGFWGGLFVRERILGGGHRSVLGWVGFDHR